MKHALVLIALVMAAAALLGGCASNGARAGAQRPPNIIVIMADDLGYGDLGCYGQKIIRTPNIDALAARGVRFVNAYSGAPVCAPSRCSLLTGMHTGHGAIRDNRELSPDGQEPLPAGEFTFATMLKPAGYATACIGKWGLGMPGTSGDPNRHGFDLFFGYYCQRHAHNHAPSFLYRNGNKVGLEGNPVKAARGDAPMAHYAPDLFREEALSFIEANARRPFLLYYATTVPHLALQVPEDSLREYDGSILDVPYDGRKGYLAHERPRAAYAAMISRMDRDIGAILSKLREKGLEDNTLVVFTSDNGPTYTGGADSAYFDSSGGLRGVKGQLYEGGIRVPLIIRWPSRLARAGECAYPCANWDLCATLCAGAGVEPLATDGVNLFDHLGVAREERELYWETPAGQGAQAVRIGNFKGVRTRIRSGKSAIELYDLASDPREEHDIAAAHPEIVERVRSVMSARTPSLVDEWNFPAP